MLRFLFLLYISFLFLSGCGIDQPEQSSMKPVDPLFDSLQTEISYTKLSAKDRRKFILDLLEKNYQNKETVENWLLTKIDTSQQVVSEWSQNELLNLLIALDVNEYSNVEVRWSKFLISQNYTSLNDKFKWQTAHALSNYYTKLNDADSLSIYIEILGEGITKDSSEWIKFSYFNMMGNLAFMNSKYLNAVVNYYEAISHLDSSDIHNIGTLYFNIANTYLNLKYYDKASEYLDLCIKTIGEDKLDIDQRLLAAVIRFRKGMYLESGRIFEQVLKDAINGNSNFFLAQVYSNYGNLKIEERSFDSAYLFFSKSDSICRAEGIDFGIMVNHINRGELYIAQEKFELALNELLLAEKLALQFEVPSYTMEVFETISRIYDQLGNRAKANEYYRQYAMLEKDIIGDLPRSTLAEWAQSKDAEKLKIITKDYELSSQRYKKNIYFAGFFILLIILVFSYTYFIINSKNTKLQQKTLLEKQALLHELELKNKEKLTESLKQISTFHIKKLIKDELLLILKELPKQHQQLFNDLKLKLDQGNFEEYLDEFEIRFSSIHEDFYKKLTELAPNLTATELRICALMRLNITSKEIAMLTNRSLGTIENNRGSIRKKLNLPAEINIQEFLLKL